MADVAAIFHWSPQAFDRCPLREIIEWQDRALVRFKAMNGVSD